MSAALLGAMAAVAWGIHDLIGGLASRRVGAVTSVFYVTVLGLVGLVLWLLPGLDPVQFFRAEVSIAVASGTCQLLATLFLFGALAHGPFSMAAPVAGSFPLTSLVLAALSGIPMTAYQLVAALAVIAGVVAVSVTGERQSDSWSRRSLQKCLVFAVLAHVLFAVAIFLGQKAALVFGTAEATFAGRVAGAVLIVAILVFGRHRARVASHWLAALAFIGMLDVFAISLLNAAAATAQPQIAAVAGSAFGVVTVLLARLVLNEPIPPQRWLGIALTFAGVASLAALE